MRGMKRLLSIAFLSAFAMACSDDDPVSYSEPVGIHLAVADGDVTGSSASDDKNINTESGNPYGVFVAAAHDEIGGDPSRITVDVVTIEMDAGSDVSELDVVFDGAVEVGFVMNGSETFYPVAGASIAAGEGPGPVELDVAFDSDDIPDAEYADIASGAFKVTIEGEVADGFVALDAKADFEVTFTFTAYE